MDEHQLTEDIRTIAKTQTWQPELFTDLLKKYNVTAEMLMQRLTNILPHHFGIEDLFFIRLSGNKDLNTFSMTKDLHFGTIAQSIQ